jgi:hypothetical protein
MGSVSTIIPHDATVAAAADGMVRVQDGRLAGAPEPAGMLAS